MADAVHAAGVQRGKNRQDIDPGGRQQRFPERCAKLVHMGFQRSMFHIEDLPDKGIAVGMDPAGGQTENHIACLHRFFPDDFFLIDDADRKAGQVIVLRLHGAGVLRGFAADQGTAGLNAAFRDARDQGCDLFGLVSADGDVVEEKQRLCTAADDVVDAHGDAVDADGMVDAHQLGDALLGADAVRTGNEDGRLHAGELRTEQTAEAADVRDNTGNESTLNMLLHETDALIAGLDVDAGGGVGCGVRMIHV